MKVVWLDKVGHVLGLGRRAVSVVIVAVSVVVRVWVVCRADVVHLVRGTALHAASLGLLTGELKRISDAIARSKVKGDHTVIQSTPWESAGKPVQPQYCSLPAEFTMIGSSGVPVIR